MERTGLRKALIDNPLIYFSYFRIRNILNHILYNDVEFYSKNYKRTHGEYPDLTNPKTYSEKLIWLMLNHRDERYVQYANKYDVREFVKNSIGEKYLIKCYDIYSNIEDINFDDLPNSFVMKATHASGWNLICQNKNEINKRKTFRVLNYWLKHNYYNFNREWPYKFMNQQIICEEYIGSENGTPPMDYKIFCFDGVPKLIQLDIARFKYHQRNVYDIEWNQIKDVEIAHEQDYTIKYEKPKNLEVMLNVASKLSKGFEHVRIDLYNVDGRIYFGEMTFFHGAGVYEYFRPKEFHQLLGSWLNLPKANVDTFKVCYSPMLEQ